MAVPPPPPWPVLLLVRKLDHGGCERDLSKIAQGLDRKLFEPHVGCFQPVGLRVAELQAAGIPIVQFPVTSFKSRSALQGAWQMRKYFRQHRIQLVHAYDVPTALFAAPVSRACGIPAVITSQLSYRSLYSPREHRLLRHVDRLAHRVVVNCQAMFRHMTEDEGLPREKAYLCYNGVDTGTFAPRPHQRPPELRDASLVIGTIANLREEKGLDILLRAFAQTAAIHTGLKLLLVGSGPEETKLRELAGTLGIAEQCLFVPGKPDVTEEMRWLDIFVIPSHSEAFSNALLEAMATGCCCVGSQVGGMPELIRDGQTGLLFPPGDVGALAGRLSDLAGHPARRAELARQALHLAATEFPLTRNVATMQSLYQGLLTSPRGGAA